LLVWLSLTHEQL